MLAIAAALQLFLASQLPPPETQGAEPPAATEEGPPPASSREAPAAAPPDETPAPAAPRPRQQSLLSGESLRGGSAALAWVGWPDLGAAYAIGFSPRDDGGLSLSHDWAKSETRFAIIYRRALSRAGPFDLAGRLSVAWFVNSGADFVYEENHSDHGFDFAPGLSLSDRVGGGIFSILIDAPMTVTYKFASGFLFSPRLGLAYETMIYTGVTVGARAGVGYRAGAGDAPLREGRGELQFVVLAGYQLL
jgi:hypothetical protein